LDDPKEPAVINCSTSSLATAELLVSGPIYCVWPNADRGCTITVICVAVYEVNTSLVGIDNLTEST